MSEFRPDWAVHPGETLAEILKEHGLSQAKFARRVGYSQKHVNRVIKGYEPISPQFAVAVERTIGVSARTLARLQTDWDVYQAEHGQAPIGWRR